MLMWLFPFSFNPTLSCPCNDQTSTQSSKVGHDRFRLIWPDWSFSRATRFQIQHISRLSLRRILNLFSEVLATPLLAVTYGPKKNFMSPLLHNSRAHFADYPYYFESPKLLSTKDLSSLPASITGRAPFSAISRPCPPAIQ
jgi:hypothetical protein